MTGCPIKHPEPKGFHRLNRDHRGLPVPYAMRQNPLSQTTVDPPRVLECLQRKLCAVCGLKLDNKKWFIGGYRTMVYRIFVDGPMHRVCAEYALRVCPFLSNPKQKYRVKPEKDSEILRQAHPSRDAGVQVLMRTKGYQIQTLQDTLVSVAEPWEHVEFWRAGKKLEEVPADAPTLDRYVCEMRKLADQEVPHWRYPEYDVWARSVLDWNENGPKADGQA